jgi:hypothetical protein
MTTWSFLKNGPSCCRILAGLGAAREGASVEAPPLISCRRARSSPHNVALHLLSASGWTRPRSVRSRTTGLNRMVLTLVRPSIILAWLRVGHLQIIQRRRPMVVRLLRNEHWKIGPAPSPQLMHLDCRGLRCLGYVRPACSVRSLKLRKIGKLQTTRYRCDRSSALCDRTETVRGTEPVQIPFGSNRPSCRSATQCRFSDVQ